MSTLLQMKESEHLKFSPEHSAGHKENTLENKAGDIARYDYRKMRPSKYNIFHSTIFGQAITTSYLCPWELSYTEPSFESWTALSWNLSTAGETVKAPFMLDLECLSISKKVVSSLFGRIKRLSAVESVFYSLEETPDRPPGFILEIIVVIPESNRETEYKIYNALGELMRNNPKMLMDLHIVKRREREVEEVIPPEYIRIRE